MTEHEPEADAPGLHDGWLADDLLRIDITEIGTSRVLALHGELDANTAPQLREHVIDLVSPDRRLVIDTTELEFCGSSGLAVFLEAQHAADTRESELRMVVPAGSPLLRVLDVVGLTGILPITPDLGTALR